MAIYGRRKRWAMTERPRAALHRDAVSFALGPSALSWNGSALTIDFDEVAVPFPRRIGGLVRVHPRSVADTAFALDSRGQHRWKPIAPCARVEVNLRHPALRWNGDGYLDSNDGDVPLERSFVRWDWSRAATRDGTTVLYDVTERDGSEQSLALGFGNDGSIAELEPPPIANLPPNGWRVARRTRSEGQAAVVRTLENAPFYARSLVATRLRGEDALAMHESLSLDRFASRIVQLMLPFRMPRAPR